MNPPDWRALAAWQLHTPEFDSLRVNIAYPAGPVVDLRTVDDWGPGLRQRWLSLPLHPNLLSCIALTSDGVAIRYPALSWRRDSTATQRVLVKWGRQLVDVLSVVANHIDREHLGLFVRPLVKIDVGGHARVGFLPLQKGDDPFVALPKDIQKKWPKCTESAGIHQSRRLPAAS